MMPQRSPLSITVDDVRRACERLPAPIHHVIAEVTTPRFAAILIPIVDDGGRAAVVATKRHGDMRSHADDWVFPGGAQHHEDTSPADTARREASEELGVALEDITILGQLDSYGPIISGFIIDVFVGVISPHATLRPDASEVEEITIVPLSDLAAPGRSFLAGIAPGHDPGERAPGARLDLDAIKEMPWYTLRDGEHMWGLQGTILHQLLGHLTGGAHFPGW